jgi:threonine/homoserine/homoserine lactone efflux protein
MTLDLLLIGLAIALEPLPVSAHILVLASEGGARKGMGFVLGWVVTLVGVVVATVTVTGGKPLLSRSAPSTASLLAKILLGALLLVFAWHKRRQRGRPPAEPKWMAKVDRLNFVTAMALGFLLQPWPLVAAGAVTATEADLSNPATVLALVGFCVLASSSYVSMQAYVIRSPDSARARLDGLNRWISVHRDQVVVFVSVVVGLWLVTASGYRLAT